MNRTLSLIFVILSVTLSSFQALGSERAETGWVLINQGALLVDVRTSAEFEESHLNGALNYPLHQIDQHFAHVDKDQTIVLYCRSGNRSGQAFQYLKSQGFTNLHNAGGLMEMLENQP
jgi:phage shock protein E